MRKVLVDPAVIQDIQEASDYYNREQPGLGKTFRNYVENAFEKIAKQPAIYKFMFKPYRGCILDKFPFIVYFRETADMVYIIGVFHQRRHPDRWRERLNH